MEWREVIGRCWNYERPFVFYHIILMKMLGICRAKYNLEQITRRMDLLERGLHAGLLVDAKSEGADREGRAASGEEEEKKTIARS